MQLNNISLINSSSPIPVEQIAEPVIKETKRIGRIVAEAFLQLAIAFSLNLAVMAFTATPLSIAVFTGALVGALVSTVLHMAIDAYYQNSGESTQKSAEGLKNMAQASMVNVVGSAGPNIAIHEVGHGLAAKAVFRNSKPKIQIFPFLGGMTSFTPSHGLTKLGSFLGVHNSLLVVTAAGIMASTFFGMFEFAVADKIQDSYPTLSRLLSVHGTLQILQEVLYGLTTFVASKADLAHDFVRLWAVGGIHPLIPIALMIALPLMEIWALKFFRMREKSEKITEIVTVLPIEPQNPVADQSVPL